MLLALDVHYKEKGAKVVGVLFNWDDSEPKEIFIEYVEEINEYIPGEFYKRELPCLHKIIEKVDKKALEAVIVDGYVFISNQFEFGLGGKLWESLEKKVPVIGVAKTSFHKNKETVKEVYRGDSKKPLYISAIDYDLDTASDKIKKMIGSFRMPQILKQLDTLTRDH